MKRTERPSNSSTTRSTLRCNAFISNARRSGSRPKKLSPLIPLISVAPSSSVSSFYFILKMCSNGVAYQFMTLHELNFLPFIDARRLSQVLPSAAKAGAITWEIMLHQHGGRLLRDEDQQSDTTTTRYLCRRRKDVFRLNRYYVSYPSRSQEPRSLARRRSSGSSQRKDAQNSSSRGIVSSCQIGCYLKASSLRPPGVPVRKARKPTRFQILLCRKGLGYRRK